MEKIIKTNKREISDKSKTYIIAEIGNNHNGKYSLAKKSIIAAANCGANAVKFQSYSSEEFMSNKNLVYKYKTDLLTFFLFGESLI